MDAKTFFTSPNNSSQKRYEALKAFYCGGVSPNDILQQFGFSSSYFKKVRSEFIQSLKNGINPFFETKKTGPKARRIQVDLIEKIVLFRKRNFSISDIKAALHADNQSLSLDTIDKILKDEGFAPLPKRSHQERIETSIPQKITTSRSAELILTNEEFTTEHAAGCLLFLPLLHSLGIIDAIKKAAFPKTNDLSDLQMILSFLALKLMGNKRWSHDTDWNMDRALGFFAGLNVLPKSTTLSTYSYRVTRSSNYELLKQLSLIFKDVENDAGDFNLDFKAIPHWGDDSILEKNWCGSRSKAMKSILSLIVQNPGTNYISYTNAELNHDTQNDAVLDFVDFWTEGTGTAPKMLIFDSKLTTYQNLDKLNKSKEGIKFLTLRRRGKSLIAQTNAIPESEWQYVFIERSKGKKQKIRIHDGRCKLRHYEGEVREIILTDHGRERPTFLITNDFETDAKDLIKKYARRWLVEKEIAEQIVFFHLNTPSSSIVVKVDFDLTLSVLAHNLYQYVAKKIPGFENCNADTIFRKFFSNGAKIKVLDGVATIQLKKKTHLPLLMELPWLKTVTHLPWREDLKIAFEASTST